MAEPADLDRDTRIDPGPAGPGVEPQTTIDEEVLGGEDHRTRLGALWGVLVAHVFAIALVATLPAEVRARHWVYAAFLPLAIVSMAINVAVLVATLRGHRSPYTSAATGVVIVSVILLGVAGFGFASFPVIGLATAVFYFGLSDNPVRRLAVFVASAGGYFLLLVGFGAGLIPPNRTPFEPTNPVHLWGTGTWVLVVLLMTYWMARRSRASTLEAMNALENARRKIRRNLALLQEAHADLDALAAGAKVGRYTGQDVDGHRVGEVLGRGAMGEIYAVEHVETGAPRAMKVLHQHVLVDDGARERFEREAAVVEQLRSPHVPRAYGHGVLADGAPYLLMERLEGRDLAEQLRERGRLRLVELDELVHGVASGLDEAHAAGIVHRDIKPQNLFFVTEPEPRWKVLDFGVSKLARSSGTLTRGGMIGTPGYMAPEQIQNAAVDARADVFALGAVLYRAATGGPAFTAGDEVALMFQVLQRQPVAPSDLVDLPRELEDVLAVALAKDPEQRFESARALEAAWRAAREGAPDASVARRAEAILAERPWKRDP